MDKHFNSSILPFLSGQVTLEDKSSDVLHIRIVHLHRERENPAAELQLWLLQIQQISVVLTRIQ